LNLLKKVAHKLSLHKVGFVMKIYYFFISKKYNLPKENNVIVDLKWGKLKSWSPAGSSMGRNIYLHKVFEPEVTDLISNILKKGMVTVDVGADMGYFSVLMAKSVSDSGRVFAFEPIPWGYDRLIENLKLNNLSNVTPYNYALFDKNGISTMPDPQKVSMLAGKKRVNKMKNSIEVNLKVFDEVVQELKITKMDFVKIDCEGAEMNILLGMKSSIKTFFPEFIIEIHYDKIKNFGFLPKDVYEFMSPYGYKNEIISETALEKHIYFFH